MMPNIFNHDGKLLGDVLLQERNGGHSRASPISKSIFLFMVQTEQNDGLIPSPLLPPPPHFKSVMLIHLLHCLN